MHVRRGELADPAFRARYDALFEATPGAFVQQSSHWADILAATLGDEPILLLCDDRAALALYLFRGELGRILTSVPGPGPLGGVFGATSEEEYAALLEEALTIAREHDCIALTLITNPFCDDLALYERCIQPTYVFENFQQHLDLSRPVSMAKSFRKHLNRARRLGYTAMTTSSAADFESWYEVHANRHRDVGATPLPRPFLRDVFGLADQGKSTLVITKLGNEIVGGCLYIHHREVMDVFMLSGKSEHLEAGANLVNTSFSLELAKTMGVRWYNWQSSPSRGSGVYTYKERWDSVEAPYYFVTKLLRPIDGLTAARIKEHYPWHYVVPFGAFDEPRAWRFRKE